MNEKFKQILKRPDGSKVSIQVRLSVDYDHVGEFIYEEEVEVCGKGKRTLIDPCDRESFQYRKLDMRERARYRHEVYRKVATAEEILAVKMKLWEMLKPTL